MVEPGHDLANHMLELREVHQKPGRVELRPFKGHANAVIMTVHVLALASVSAQGMSCRKGLFYADLKHVSPKLRYSFAAGLPGSWPSGATCRMGPQPLGTALHIKKPGDIGQFVRHPESWQRLQENFTIGHALEAGIQQREHAPVGLRSNQTPKSLLQRKHPLRHPKFRPPVAPRFP